MSAPLPAHESADSPYLLRKQRETLLCFKILTIKRSHIAHRTTCLPIAGGAATQRHCR